MNPTLGMFLTEDTVPGRASLPRSLHIYVYAWNNPINLLDPSGKQVPVPCDENGLCATQSTGGYVVQTPPVNPPPPLPPPSPPDTFLRKLLAADTCRHQAPPGEDWGALLIYQIPSLLYQRTEYVAIKIEGELGAVSGDAQFRHVVLNPLAGLGTYSEFDEVAGNVRIGANVTGVGGVNVGGEVNYNGQELSLSPSVSADLFGGQISLQPNQAMGGYVNRATGMGINSGFEWKFSRQVWALTTKYAVDISGGPALFGKENIDSNAELRSEHYEPPHGSMSGFDYLRWILRGNDISMETH